jgi:hypothetical protein
MIDPTLIEELIAAWNYDQNQPMRCRVKRELYPKQVIKAFVEEAFFASLQREEERTIRFSAVLVSMDNASTGIKYNCEIHKLAKPVPFTAPNIGKMAPATDPDLCSLGVAPDADGELVMWGIFSYEPTCHLYNEVPIVAEYSRYLRPDFLTVSTKAPGSLVFSRQNSMIGRLVNGIFVSAMPTAFSEKSLGRFLIPLIRAPFEWHHSRQAIQALLDEAARRGHGATIVFLDSASTTRASDLFVSKYVFSDDLRLGTRVISCINAGKKESLEAIVEMVGTRKIALETLQRIAQLAVVDGALVINNAFSVLAFGATMTAPLWEGNIVTGPDALGQGGGKTFDLTRYGTRHRSALNFAAACPGCVVFVVSQDGPIRAFAKKDETTVLCWPDCTASMFV